MTIAGAGFVGSSIALSWIYMLVITPTVKAAVRSLLLQVGEESQERQSLTLHMRM